MKYKWKDKVRIKSKKELECISEVTNDMLKNGGTVMTIACLVADADAYLMKEDGDFHFLWTDEMIECKVEEETKNWADISIPDGPYTVTYGSPSMNDSMNKNNIDNGIIILPEGYIFKDENGNEILTSKIILEKKKKEYPKTYEECYKVLGLSEFEYNHTGTKVWYRHRLMAALDKLILCRDAYWKIAGEEMGLNKPWEPDWSDYENIKYIIGGYDGEIGYDQNHHIHKSLAFPTEEMRDAFYENFKELIEVCKELL